MVRLILHFLLSIALVFMMITSSFAAAFDDWVPDPEGYPLCQGYYVQPTDPSRGIATPLLNKKATEITADEGQFTQDGNSILNGHVHLIQSNQQVYSDSAVIHRDPKKSKAIDWIEATGHVKILEPGLRVDGTSALVNTETDNQVVQNASFRLYDRHARGIADQITINKQTKMTLKQATYTTCSPGNNTWQLKAKNVVLNKTTGRGRARHSRLYFYDIPIFYLPYVDFPIDDRRKTGFLFPIFGMTNRSGTELGAPFYWNIAPNYDATITPRLLSKRGLELQGQFRYLSEESQGEIEAGILPNDRAYRDFRLKSKANHPLIPNNDPRITALNTNNTRQALRVKHHSQFNENFAGNIQYQTVRDDNYLMDFGNNIGIASNNYLLQQEEFLFQSNHWNLQTRLQQYQTLHPFEGPITGDPYKRLPQIALQNRYPDLPYGLNLETKGEFSHFLHKHNPMTGNTFTTGDRMWLRPGISLPVVTLGWYVKPRIQWDILAYSLSLGSQDLTSLKTNSSRAIPIFDFDSGLIFERNLALQQEPYIQTLEPRLYYLYVPYRQQNALPNFDTGYSGFDFNQLYWDNRFVGLDRLGDANQVTFGLTSRFIKEKTGSERLSLTAGQIIYFRDRQVTSCNPKSNPLCINQELPDRQHRSSALVGLARYAIHDDWIARAQVEWNPYQKQLDKKGISLQYHPEELAVVNLGYQFLRHTPFYINPATRVPNQQDRIDQTDLSMAWPITEKWRTLGRWHYDLHRKRSNDISVGFEQQGCCTVVRVFASRFLLPYDNTLGNAKRKYTKAIFLQFVFKGFAGVGNSKMQTALKQAIPDYRWRDDDF